MEDTKKNNSFLSVPERQSPVAIVLILFRFIRLIVRQLFPILIIILINPSRLKDSWLTIGLAVVGGTSAILSILAYFKFYFYIKNNELVIEKGLFQKKKLNIPFHRIQTINFNQNIIHRFFNVVAIEIDTAGSKGNEFSINALSKEKAERIRTYLLAQKQELQADAPSLETVREIAPVRAPDQLLLRLGIGDLIKIGLGQNHLRSVGIIIGTLFGWLQFAEDALDKKQYNAYHEQYASVILQSMTSIAIFILIVAFIITLISTVIRFYDFRFYQTYQGFKIQTGLFNRKENAAKMSKIQFVRWSNNPIKKWLGLFGLQLFQAASSAVSRKQSILVPGCYEEQIQAVRKAYFPQEAAYTYETHGIQARILIRLILSYGFVPLIAYFLLKNDWEFTWTKVGYSAAWLIFVVLASYRYFKNWQFQISPAGILLRHGLWTTNYTSLQWYKIQSVQIRQTIFQKRRHLCDIHFYTAAGTLRIPYIKVAKAYRLKNYILFKIESSVLNWM